MVAIKATGAFVSFPLSAAHILHLSPANDVSPPYNLFFLHLKPALMITPLNGVIVLPCQRLRVQARFRDCNDEVFDNFSVYFKKLLVYKK
jgi:hypothetical protein